MTHNVYYKSIHNLTILFKFWDYLVNYLCTESCTHSDMINLVTTLLNLNPSISPYGLAVFSLQVYSTSNYTWKEQLNLQAPSFDKINSRTWVAPWFLFLHDIPGSFANYLELLSSCFQLSCQWEYLSVLSFVIFNESENQPSIFFSLRGIMPTFSVTRITWSRISPGSFD